MKRATNALFGATCAALMTAAAFAQSPQLFVYPQKGQSQQQLDIDTAECQRWAKTQSGIDPNAPPAPGQPGQHARGALGGAARGAGLGAAIGAIAGDAGKGAAAGAVAGGVAGRRQAKIAQQAKQAEATSSYERAFAACMEGRGYTVK